MWRSREVELVAKLTEQCQHHLQLECEYETILATNTLQFDTNDPVLKDTDETVVEEACKTGDTCSSGDQDRKTVISDRKTPTPPDVSPDASPQLAAAVTTSAAEVTAMWKDLPPNVMTDSIGPLEELCLVPDDPMITSVYLNHQPD